jgi:hypothetical protein
MAPWYELPHSGGVPMWFDHKRADLKPAKAPKKPAKDEGEKASPEPEPAESEAKA